ncbi:beta strand repeat-containing protein, partial [Flavobacterium sp. UBA6135]|uniref:beta strand repeat-containing protein n=1 Tax=Flavobacterium sp. UBA6135 TaxID=1946553 RepID=UPI0025BAE860
MKTNEFNFLLRLIKRFCVLIFFSLSLQVIAQPTWQSSTTAVGSNSSANITKPSGIVAGDLLIAGVMFESGSSATLAVPTGWTLILRTNQSSNIGMATYYKIASATESASDSWGFGGGKWSIGISRITGASVDNIISNGTASSSSSTSVVAPSITTTSANNLILNFYSNKKDATYTAASGTTERYDAPNTSGGLPSNMMATYVQATLGETGAKTAIASVSETWIAQTIVLSPCITSAGTLSGTQAICLNGATQLNSTVLGGTWSSNNTAVATVNSSGVVTGLSVGTATITYTIAGIGGCLNGTATRTVTVNQTPITANAIVCAGGTGELTATSSCLDLTGQTSGPNDAGTGANVTGVGGSNNWSNPNNITISGSNATRTLSGGQISNYLRGTNYGFQIPSNAIINGISVIINRQSSSVSSGGIQDNEVKLVVGGTIQTTNKAVTATNWLTSSNDVTYGEPTDLWGISLTAEEINAADFGVVLSARNANTSSSRTANVAHMQITVTYTLPGSLNWYTVSSGGTIIGTGSSFNPVGVSNSGLVDTNTPGTTSYWVECTTTPGACRTKADFVINAAPSVGTLSGTQAICIAGSTTLSSTVSGGTWSSSDDTIATIDSQSGEVTGVAAGEATMTYTVAGIGGCSDATATRIITVTAPVVAGTLSGTQAICIVGSTTL